LASREITSDRCRLVEFLIGFIELSLHSQYWAPAVICFSIFRVEFGGFPKFLDGFSGLVLVLKCEAPVVISVVIFGV
jgi:hypothetical protein